MKKIFIIALAIVAALTMTGCKNNKKNQEPTQEEIQAQKQALADSVLAKIDALAEEYFCAGDHSFCFLYLNLTEAEKMVKPEYLLDPAEANKLVSKTQKVNALAIYLTELCIRTIYDMPVDETKEAIARLAVDINYPLDYDMQHLEMTPSENVKAEYARCKDNGDLFYFWQFQNAFLAEIDYIVANNPDLILNRISDEQAQAVIGQWNLMTAALEELSKYDDEMSAVWKFRKETRIAQSPEDCEAKWGTLEAARQTYAANKDKIIARRNALLQ